MIQMQFGQFVHTMTVHAAFQHETDQHRIVNRADENSLLREDNGVIFDVLTDLQHAWIFQQWL